ncbi:carbohydrate ABC transporter permease [Lapillicoccus jejuensis]|uniref:Carbohydrate ABC transporter membrane protein 1 (CUT1 family) n=2 Tax=Lapillicoccus jejuensis TaxID=402171 RepID=A0A542E4T7_9MICO|nr:sugar ABC transporter permease [Lapillicoccus jejuensis]TQJ10362.1 carbohydrate ABC transporter membrane protein 1 (CUT1 family) [Lapillicoccus jejuensis]
MTAPAQAPAAGGKAPRRRRPLSFDRISFFAVFLLVPLALYLYLVVSPIIQAFYFSLTDWSGYDNNPNFVGLTNYVNLVHDDLFWTALRNNIVLAIVLPLVTVVLSLTLATLVTVGGSSRGQTRGIGGSGFYRVVSFFPYCIPAIVTGILWQQIYSPQGGLLNGFLDVIGFHNLANTPWLGDPNLALGAIVVAIVWSFVGFYMVLFVAAIKSIPAEIYEAARLDGAGRLRTAVRITVPLIRDNVNTAVVYLAILGLDAFTYMAVLAPSGGPDNRALVVTQYLYTNFTNAKYGYAIAMGVALALVTLVVSIGVLVSSRKQEVEL